MEAGERATPVIIALIALVMIKGVLFSAMLPAWEGDDEAEYWNDIRLIAGETPAAGGTQHGRLYPLLAAPIYKVAGSLPPNLRVLAVRLLGLLFYAAIVCLTFLAARRLWPASLFIQLAAPFIAAFNPKLSFVMAPVSTDVLLIFLFSSFLVLTTAFILEPTKPKAVLLAAVVVLGWLTKQRFLIALPLLGLVLAVLAVEHLVRSRVYKDHRQKFWLAGAGLAAVLWQLRPAFYGWVGTGLGRNSLAAFTLDRHILGIWGQPWFRYRMFRQFWGFFALDDGIYLSEPIYKVLLALTLLALLGLALRVYRAGRSVLVTSGVTGRAAGSGLVISVRAVALEDRRRALAIALHLLALWVTGVATGAYELSGSAALGRYLLIAIMPATLFMAAGLEALLPRKHTVGALLALAGAGFFLNILSITAFLMPRFY